MRETVKDGDVETIVTDDIVLRTDGTFDLLTLTDKSGIGLAIHQPFTVTPRVKITAPADETHKVEVYLTIVRRPFEGEDSG